jgi:autoinducer 2-degrading protein
MIVTLVNVRVKKDHLDDFINATVENHTHSVMEEGNLRFDVLRNNSDPCRFTLYEAYESEAAAAKHKETAHYLKWRDAVAPWMEHPREGVSHSVIMPSDKKGWK